MTINRTKELNGLLSGRLPCLHVSYPTTDKMNVESVKILSLVCRGSNFYSFHGNNHINYCLLFTSQFRFLLTEYAKCQIMFSELYEAELL